MLKNIRKLRGKNRQVFLYEKAIIFTRKETREFDDGKEDVVYQFKSLIKVCNNLYQRKSFCVTFSTQLLGFTTTYRRS